MQKKKSDIQLRKKSLTKRRREQMIRSLNEVDEPVKKSIATAGIWIVILIIFSVLLTQLNNSSYLLNFMTCFAIGIALAVLWILLRIGLLERWLVKLKNYRNARIVRKAELADKNIAMSLETYRAFVKKHSWIGIWVLLGASALVVLITATVYYL